MQRSVFIPPLNKYEFDPKRSVFTSTPLPKDGNYF